MSDNLLLVVCIGGVIVFATIIILLANWADSRRKKSQGKKLMQDKANGSYDGKKKYFGEQGKWEPGEQNDWNNNKG